MRHTQTHRMTQPVNEDGTQQSVVGHFELGVATHNRANEEPTFRTGFADGGSRCVERIELSLLAILREIVDRIDQMREPTEIGTDGLDVVAIVGSAGDVSRGREDTSRRLRRRAEEIVEVRRPRFDPGLPRQPREHGVDVEQARHIAVVGGTTSQRRGNPSCDHPAHPRRRRQPGPLFFDDVGGLTRGERQRDPGGQSQSRITDRDDLGRLHSTQRAAADMRRRRRRITLCRNENRHHRRIGISRQPTRMTVPVTQRKTQATQVSLPLREEVVGQRMATRCEESEHRLISARLAVDANLRHAQSHSRAIDGLGAVRLRPRKIPAHQGSPPLQA